MFSFFWTTIFYWCISLFFILHRCTHQMPGPNDLHLRHVTAHLLNTCSLLIWFHFWAHYTDNCPLQTDYWLFSTAYGHKSLTISAFGTVLNLTVSQYDIDFKQNWYCLYHFLLPLYPLDHVHAFLSFRCDSWWPVVNNHIIEVIFILWWGF